MIPTLQAPGPTAPDPLSPGQASALLAQARTLQQAAHAGTLQPLLRGKNFGLWCADDADADAQLFRSAAQELGAHVAYIRPSLSEASTPQEVQHTARVLGRLYDAVECQGLPDALLQRMAGGAGVPVYDGVATAGHPSARLAAQLDGAPADNRRFVLQALLVGSVG